MVTLVKELQFMKVPHKISATELGIITLDKELQLSKAPQPM